MGLPSDADTDAYIAQQAARLGINPTIALQVSHAERSSRSTGWIGDQGSSFGPFQLHYGGISRADPGGGLGEVFTAHTGLNARDIANTWKQQIDFALNWAQSVSGWAPFHAAAAIGIGTWDGIRKGVGNVVASAAYFFPIVGYAGNPKDTYHTSGATDLFAPAGTPIRDVTDGRVTDVSATGPGGNSLVIHGLDGLDYYYAHLRDAPLVHAGDYVAGGQVIGLVGQTGNAEGKPPHLHLGIGYSIQTGTGPTGGTGKNFDAQSFLTNILNMGGASQGTHGVLADIGNAATGGVDIAGGVRQGAADVGSTLLQKVQNYVQDRAASIAFLTLGIVLILAGIWGFASQSETVRNVTKAVVAQVGGPAGAVVAAA